MLNNILGSLLHITQRRKKAGAFFEEDYYGKASQAEDTFVLGKLTPAYGRHFDWATCTAWGENLIL